MKIDQRSERVFCGDASGRRVNVVIDRALDISGPRLGVGLHPKSLGQDLACTPDLGSPAACTFVDGGHMSPLHDAG